MKQKFMLWIVCFNICVIIGGCGDSAGNYKNASIAIKGDKYYIHLKGRRKYMVHDLISLFSNKTYEVGTIMVLPKTKDGIIKNVYFNDGTYKEDGFISINNQELTIDLHDYDTVGKRIIQDPWNGVYKLTSNK